MFFLTGVLACYGTYESCAVGEECKPTNANGLDQEQPIQRLLPESVSSSEAEFNHVVKMLNARTAVEVQYR